MAHILNSHQQHDSFQLPAHLRGHRMLSLSASQWLAPLWLPTLTRPFWQLSFYAGCKRLLWVGRISGCRILPNHSLLAFWIKVRLTPQARLANSVPVLTTSSQRKPALRLWVCLKRILFRRLSLPGSLSRRCVPFQVAQTGASARKQSGNIQVRSGGSRSNARATACRVTSHS